MRVVRLTHGPGNGVDKACLMTASNMLIGRGEDYDDNACVCPVLRQFIIYTNDNMPIELLEELYTPLVWEILGTRNNKVLQLRVFAFVDWSCREVLPICLESAGLHSEAEICRGLSPITNKKTAKDAAITISDAVSDADIIGTLGTIGVGNSIAKVVNSATSAATSAANVATRVASNTNAASTVLSTANVAINTASIATIAGVEADKIWRMCPEIIRRVAAIGDKRPVECVITHDQLCDALEGRAG